MTPDQKKQAALAQAALNEWLWQSRRDGIPDAALRYAVTAQAKQFEEIKKGAG